VPSHRQDVISLLTPHHLALQSWSSTTRGHNPESGASSGPRSCHSRLLTHPHHPLNPFSWLGLPSPSQFIIGSSFLQGKSYTSASLLRASPMVSHIAPERATSNFYLLSEYGGYLPLLPEIPNPLGALQHTIPTASLVCHSPL
jgi:hypothetical protein